VDLPVGNLKEFVTYAKANQAKMQYSSAGAGSRRTSAAWCSAT
jgi:tripartite-type tricarboxylate transporter receptor subunit TctC